MNATYGMIAMLQQQATRGPSMLAFMIQLGAIIAIMYFILLRPQRKAAQRHREMVAALKRGDEVMTEGGVIGEVVHLKEDRVTIRTAENTRIVIARPKIARVFAPAEPEQT